MMQLPVQWHRSLCALPAAFVVLVFLGGCNDQRSGPSGFLNDYGELRRTGRGDDRAYVREGVDWAAYHKIIIDTPREAGEVRLSEEDQAHLRLYLEQALQDTLKDRFAIVADPAPGTLRIRSAITEVGKANPLLNIPAVIVAWPVDYGGVTAEMEVVDADTGRRLCALVASRTADPFQFFESFTWLGHARRGLVAIADHLGLIVKTGKMPEQPEWQRIDPERG